MALNRAQEKAIRTATLPLVQDLVTALIGAGMTREKALKTIRWASYRLVAGDTTDQEKQL